MTWCALYGEAEFLTQMTEPRTRSYAEDGSGANMLHYIFTMPRLPGLIFLPDPRPIARAHLSPRLNSSLIYESELSKHSLQCRFKSCESQ